MATKFLQSPANLANTASSSNSNNNSNGGQHQIGCCTLSFRHLPAKLSPKTNLLHFSYNRFHREAHLVRVASLGDADNLQQPPSSSTTSEEEAAAAREAVSEILREFGASMEDSIDIAHKSPKYLAMLIDSVRDLDELSLWSPWTRTMNEEREATPISLKEKVYYMAKEKGDKGLLPFLESLGLALPLASRFARSLSSQMLPKLIHKVKYVKEVFFSTSDDEGLIGKKARQMMMHLSIPVDEDVQQTLSFFEKIEARRGGLDMLGSGDAAFRYLIESFPRILLLSVESHMKPMVKFLENIGAPRGRTRDILILFPPIMFYGIEKDIKMRIRAFAKVGAGNKDIGRMLLKYPWILSIGIQENYEEILSFFDMEKVPKVSVDFAIKSWPLLLGCSISKLKGMVEQFGELGVRKKKLGQVIATSPQLLLRKTQGFLQVVEFFNGLGLDDETIGQILGRCPEIFAASIEKTLKKKLDFLTAIGVSQSQLPRVIRKCPELFVCDVDRTLRPRIEYLVKMGLSERDVALMVCRFSPLLGYSIEQVLRPKLEFLLTTMEKPAKDVVDYPRYFSYSLEKKIKYRYWVLKARDVEFSLKDMLGKNDEDFAADFMGVGTMHVSPSPLSSLDDR